MFVVIHLRCRFFPRIRLGSILGRLSLLVRLDLRDWNIVLGLYLRSVVGIFGRCPVRRVSEGASDRALVSPLPDKKRSES